MIQEEKANILLIDDNRDKLLALQAALEDLGENMVMATSGRDGLRLLLKQEFAVILLDVNMPVMDGFETAALIRQRQNSEHTPIIFVTAFSTTDEQVYKGYSLGAVDYLFTPIIPEVLKSKVSVFVDLWKKSQQIKGHAEWRRQVEEKEHQQRLEQTREKLEVETKRNRFFVLSIEMLAISDFQGRFKQLNPTWEKVLGFKDEELKSRSFLEMVHPDDREATQLKLDGLKMDSKPITFEVRCREKDGAYRWLECSVASFIAEQLLYFFARDVTERKKSEQQIQALNRDLERRAGELESLNLQLHKEISERKEAEEALQDTNTELESFSYTVSHDLRAPLRAMQGFAVALLDDYGQHLDDMGKEYASRIIFSSRRMDNLIQDLLIYGRLSRTELQPQALEFSAIVAETMSQLENEVKERQANIEIRQPLPWVMGHFATLVQVLTNLVSNGIKFTANNAKPHVKVWSEKRDGLVRIWVQDNGIGIAPEHHSRIFRVFERLHGVEAYPGTGIGLAIVRKGMERLGGKVGLESVMDKGSKFWIELPEVKPEEVPAPLETAHS